MEKMTLETLRRFRKQKSVVQGSDGERIDIIVGMGTCGIAAGAKDSLNVFLGEFYIRKMQNVVVRQTGCMGLCHAEPTVEVKMAGMPDTLYGKVDAAVAKRIIEDHILNNRLVSGHVYEYPVRDIYMEG